MSNTESVEKAAEIAAGVDSATDGASEETVAGLLKEGTPAAAERLTTIAGSTTSREIRKAARRSLYTLAQRGVVPERAHTVREAAPAQRARTRTVRAWASAYDGAGNRLLILVLPGEDGAAATVAQILGNDELGIRNLTTERRRERELIPLLERLEGRIDEGLAMAEIEEDYARWLVHQMREINQRRSTTTPAGFLDLYPRIGAPVSTYEESPVYSGLDLSDTEEEVPEDPASLFDLPWFEPWFYAADDVIPWLRQWLEVEHNTGDDSESVKSRLKRSIATEAATTLMEDRVRRLYINRLEESADVLKRRGKAREARQAIFHAQKLRAQTPISEVPFAVALAERTLEAAAEMAARAEQEAAAGVDVQEHESN